MPTELAPSRTPGLRSVDEELLSVSALIPTYNRREQVLRAIDSVFAQTQPVDEVIVVDDGSSDGTVETIRARYGPLVRLFVQENAGAAAARNRGIREARSRWVAFLDSDDVWLSTKIERQLSTLAALGSEFGLCFTDCVFEGDPAMTASAFQEAGLDDVDECGAFQDASISILEGREPFYTPTVLADRLLLERVGRFDEALTIREDTDVFFRLSLITKFCFVPAPLVRVDRAPSRSLGLCKLYSSRNDQKYASLERLYTNWLAMPEVAGTAYERQVRDNLKLVCYSSAAAKISDLRLIPAFQTVRTLTKMGDSYFSVVFKLFSRKLQKLLTPFTKKFKTQLH